MARLKREMMSIGTQMTALRFPESYGGQSETPLDQDSARAALDELFTLAGKYNSSDAYLELMRFVGRFPFYSPFNAMLIYIQMPGGGHLRFAGSNRKYGFMGLWFYGNRRRAMKTTIEVSDDLYRRAKAEAALRGRKLKDLVAEGLRLVLETPRETPGRRSLAVLMKSARGTVDSGVSDLATNPEHLTGFGRDAQRNR